MPPGIKPILLVEDDKVDTMTVKRALKEIQVPNQLKLAANGEEALEYLQNPENELPVVILLDLNMPKMNGIEFLRIMKQDSEMKKIPVVVLTTSQEQQDKFDSYSLGVAGYVHKPVDYDQFVDAMRIISQYWNISELPY